MSLGFVTSGLFQFNPGQASSGKGLPTLSLAASFLRLAHHEFPTAAAERCGEEHRNLEGEEVDQASGVRPWKWNFHDFSHHSCVGPLRMISLSFATDCCMQHRRIRSPERRRCWLKNTYACRDTWPLTHWDTSNRESRELPPTSSPVSIDFPSCRPLPPPSSVSSSITRFPRTGWSSTAVKSSPRKERSGRLTLTSNRSNPSTPHCTCVTTNSTPKR